MGRRGAGGTTRAQNTTTPGEAGLQVRPLRHHANAMPSHLDRPVIGRRPRGRRDRSLAGRSRCCVCCADGRMHFVHQCEEEDTCCSNMCADGRARDQPWLNSFHDVVEAVQGEDTCRGSRPTAFLGPFSQLHHHCGSCSAGGRFIRAAVTSQRAPICRRVSCAAGRTFSLLASQLPASNRRTA